MLGTLFYRRHTSAENILETLALLALAAHPDASACITANPGSAGANATVGAWRLAPR